MTIPSALRQSFARSFGLYRDLAESLDSRALKSHLVDVRSNTIGEQLWCVVGARESYARAVLAGSWSGFTCSLDDPADPSRVAESLSRSEGAVLHALEAIETYTASQSRLILDLLEHEAAHHGQLIRYLYALRLAIPPSWKARYALD